MRRVMVCYIGLRFMGAVIILRHRSIGGADANLRNRFFGESPLFWAAVAANAAALESLVEAGADVNASDAQGKLLHLLAAQGKPEQAMILLAGDADGTIAHDRRALCL